MFRAFRSHLQSQNTIVGTRDASFPATVRQYHPVGSLEQMRWPFCVLFSFLFPCRVHLSEEPAGDGSFFAGPLD